jgi:glycerate kinase
LEEKTDLITNLAKSGSTIQELNCVRQCISKVKGGRLAEMAHPATVLSLILSDVIGDPLDVIASGPTVVHPIDYRRAFEIIQSRLEPSEVPLKLLDLLKNNSKNESRANPPLKVFNKLIGSNSVALDACAEEAKRAEITPLIVSHTVRGDVFNMASFCAEIVSSHPRFSSSKVGLVPEGLFPDDVVKIEHFLLSTSGPKCLIFGGETTVRVKGSGLGGRNQELALTFAKLTEKLGDNVALFLSAGTDGIDGPTDAAGAFAFPGMWARAIGSGLDADELLCNNDSHAFFERFDGGSNLIVTGHTGTNVMDVQLLFLS